MAKAKNGETQQKKKLPQVEQDFRDFRSGTAQADDVFKNLEGIFFAESGIAKKIQIPANAFLLKYILTVVLDCHLKETDQDIILAVFGFLPGYEDLGVQDRQREYCKWVGIHTKEVDEPLDVHWLPENLPKQMNTRENAAIKRLYNSVHIKMNQNGGVLGYIKGQEKIGEISSKVSPLPCYLSEKGYRKCERKGRVFYVPLTEKEKRILAFQTEQKSGMEETDAESPSQIAVDCQGSENLSAAKPLATDLPDDEGILPISYDSKLEPAPGPVQEPSYQIKKTLGFIVSLCIIVVLATVFVPHILDRLGNITTPGVTSKSEPYSTLTTPEAPSDNANAEQEIPVSLTKEERKITDEEMEKFANEAQAPILVYNESGEYDTVGMRDLILKRIVNNPIYGDMVARGLLEADSLRDGRIQKVNPWLLEFIEKTDKAMENPEQYQEGMRQWLSKAYHVISPTDEYKDYANNIFNVLTGFLTDGVYNLKATSRWYVEAEGDGIYTRAIEDSDPESQTAIVLWERSISGRFGCIIGFCIEDGSLVICDPLNLDFESFIDE